MATVDTDSLKQVASGQWPEILYAVASVDLGLLDGKHHPCPKCGGVDRFSMADESCGWVLCRKCFNERNGDGLAAVMWLTGCTFPEALSKVAAHLGLAPSDNGPDTTDLIAWLARQKKVTPEALKAYGAVQDDGLVRIPAYDEHGKRCTSLRVWCKGSAKQRKGLLEKGKPAGLFLPHNDDDSVHLPQPGETWIVVEGPKDAAALSSLDVLAVGLPRNEMAKKFGRLFRGCEVVIVHDLDQPGLNGSSVTASRLYANATGVRIARLPGEVKESGGDDVRDVLAGENGEQLVKQSLADAQPWIPAKASNKKNRPAETEDHDDRPIVLLPGGDISISECAEQLGELLAAGQRFFVRGGAVVQLNRDDDALPVLEPVKAAACPTAFESVARLCKPGGEESDEPEPAICAEGMARLILNSRQFVAKLPVLRVVSPCPVLIERGGKLIQVDGFDADSGILASGGTIDDISIDEARTLLDEVLQDFLFASPSDKSRALAAIITPSLVLGGLLGCRPPLDLGEADKSQTGKGFRNKLTAAIYLHKVVAVTQRSGGVGSLEESFNQALIQGSPFISIDNVRGRIDSQAIESFLTEDTYLARVPYSPPMKIDPCRTVLMFTSNRAELTRDLANRSNCVRVLKRPDGYRFRRYPQGRRQRGSILDQVHACQPKYLAAVFAVVRAWYDAGQPVTEESRHDFEGWAQSLDWIVQNLLGASPLMDGHKETQIRMTSPALSWLRDVAHAVERAGRLGDEMQAHAILDIIDGDPDTSIPGIDPDDDVESEEVRSKALRAMGRRLAKCFQGETAVVDTFIVTRCEAHDEDYRVRRSYLFEHDPRIATPQNPAYPAWTNNEQNLDSQTCTSTCDGGNICSLLPNAGYAGVENPCGGAPPNDSPQKDSAERGWL